MKKLRQIFAAAFIFYTNTLTGFSRDLATSPGGMDGFENIVARGLGFESVLIPPAALQNKSTSVHSKPVADILWYWYLRLLGTVK